MLQALLVKFLFLTQQFGNKLNVDRQLRYDVLPVLVVATTGRNLCDSPLPTDAGARC